MTCLVWVWMDVCPSVLANPVARFQIGQYPDFFFFFLFFCTASYQHFKAFYWCEEQNTQYHHVPQCLTKHSCQSHSEVNKKHLLYQGMPKSQTPKQTATATAITLISLAKYTLICNPFFEISSSLTLLKGSALFPECKDQLWKALNLNLARWRRQIPDLDLCQWSVWIWIPISTAYILIIAYTFGFTFST